MSSDIYNQSKAQATQLEARNRPLYNPLENGRLPIDNLEGPNLMQAIAQMAKRHPVMALALVASLATAGGAFALSHMDLGTAHAADLGPNLNIGNTHVPPSPLVGIDSGRVPANTVCAIRTTQDNGSNPGIVRAYPASYGEGNQPEIDNTPPDRLNAWCVQEGFPPDWFHASLRAATEALNGRVSFPDARVQIECPAQENMGEPVDDGVFIRIPENAGPEFANDYAQACVPRGELGDFIWNDTNADGLQGTGETGIPNMRVDLVFEGRVIASVTTDENGKYHFKDVPAGPWLNGKYRIQAGPAPSGCFWTTSNNGPEADMGVSELQYGEVDLTFDAGLHCDASTPTPPTPTPTKTSTPPTPPTNTPTPTRTPETPPSTPGPLFLPIVAVCEPGSTEIYVTGDLRDLPPFLGGDTRASGISNIGERPFPVDQRYRLSELPADFILRFKGEISTEGKITIGNTGLCPGDTTIYGEDASDFSELALDPDPTPTPQPTSTPEPTPTPQPPVDPHMKLTSIGKNGETVFGFTAELLRDVGGQLVQTGERVGPGGQMGIGDLTVGKHLIAVEVDANSGLFTRILGPDGEEVRTPYVGPVTWELTISANQQ